MDKQITEDYLRECEMDQQDSYDDAFTKQMIAMFPRLLNKKTQEEDFTEFGVIWNKYIDIMPNNTTFDGIMEKIYNRDFNFSEDKCEFIRLADIVASKLYYYKRLNEKMNAIFNPLHEYSDTEVNCCYHVKKHLMKIK